MDVRGAAVAATTALALRCRRETESPLHYYSIIFNMAKSKLETALSPGHPLSGERVRRIPPFSQANKMQVYRKETKIATWNVRSLYMAGKLDNVDAEMHRLKIKILGLSEVRWPGTGSQRTPNGTLYYSGGDDPEHQYGVAILISSELEKSVIDFVPLGDRVMLLRFLTTHRILNVIQAYAPTSKKTDEEIEEFYSTLENALAITKKGEITIVLGDFNAKIGKGAEGDVSGEFGLGIRNARGDRLIQFCTEQHLSAANTFFKQHPRRLYTWKSPADRSDHIVRNQIDFVLIKSHLMKYIKTATTYPGADISSDHNPVVVVLQLRHFIRAQYPHKYKRIDIKKLENQSIRTQATDNLETRLHTDDNCNDADIERRWDVFKKALTDTQEVDIGYIQVHKKQKWMTEEILRLMDERREQKARDNNRYKELNRAVRVECRRAKENWLEERCKEIEELQARYDLFNLHKKIKEFTNTQRKQCRGILRTDDNKILVGVEEKLKQWKEYVEILFNDGRPDQPHRCDDFNESSPDIMEEEVRRAISLQKNNKAVGPDQIHAETVKLIANTDKGLKLLTAFFNSIYKSGKIPADWLKSTFVTLPKTSKSSKCDDYRMISLMSHVLKVFLRIIHTRIYSKCEKLVGDTQFGFRSGVGTREALFSLNVLTQRCRDMNVDVYACFIDYRKAFDCVSHQKLVDILKSTGIDAGDLRFITHLYWNQTAQVRVEGSASDDIQIRRGVRQGCVLSPLLFNIYSEAVFREALDGVNRGIKINGTIINNIRFADDTVVLADSPTNLQYIVDLIVEHSKQYGLHMNIAKTKVVVFSKTPKRSILRINNEVVEQMPHVKYLGAIVNEVSDPKKEILSKIEQARRAFASMKNLFTNRNLSLQLRIRLLRCYIYPILLYGCESWTFTSTLEDRINAFEMYLYRRILRISWVDKVTNEEVLRRMGKSKELMTVIKERKLQYIGHVMRGDRYYIPQLIIEGKIEGKRSVGRRQNSWLKDLRRWLGRTSIEIFRGAVSRTIIANWIANLREERAD